MVTPNKDLIVEYQSVKSAYFTAYPSPGTWYEGFSSQDYGNAIIEVLSRNPELPIQFYVHFPYCKIQCWFCQCYQMVTHDRDKMETMVNYLIKEMDLLLALFKKHGLKPNFNELHLGGGTPSWLPIDLFDRLVDKIGTFIDLKKIHEFAIEVDPRTADVEKIKHFHSKGVNRISFGIQDFAPQVGKAVNREHTEAEIAELLKTRHLFKGVNFDLIYGLPRQTRESLKETLDTVFRLSPDRIAFSILGNRPDVFKHNAMMKIEEIPGLIERAYMWEDSFPAFLKAGYVRVGMDHFAKPNDEIAQAKYKETLFRNQMGYSPGRFADVCAIGPSGMSRYGEYYFASSYNIPDYFEFIDEGKFPVVRGYKLDKDLEIRRDIMNKIMVYYHVNYDYFSHLYNIDFKKYFAQEIEELKEFEGINAIQMKENSFTVTYFGNYFLRNLCLVFDKLNLKYMHNIESGKVIRKEKVVV
ncbi:MAG: oxygen-independent coproporphyrinogen III oxidase [Omnitrophica WOR_2 bacterium GWA2_47_8]|nr:MAG: oxygen-independent coproporphyrinogen III oxidase [Omnitrophica WOR_2 bacterium GWA2_47_8]